MANEPLTTNENKTAKRRSNAATFVVFVVAVLISIALMYSPRWSTLEVFAPEKNETALEIKGEVMEEALPVRLKIPSVNIDAPFSEPLGLQESQEIEIPKDYTSVGFYKNGPTPGELGPAVVLGHVDSFEGPAVLFSLGQAKEGDEILIERADGTVATFAVTALERHTQAGFPTTQVYSDIDHAGLRIITCTGVYDHGSLRYSHNLIVFAKLISTSTTEISE